jgi:hypothetical protein
LLTENLELTISGEILGPSASKLEEEIQATCRKNSRTVVQEMKLYRCRRSNLLGKFLT